jgi:hypothetical protein
VVTIVSVNEEMKEHFVARAPVPNVHAIGSGIRFDEGLDSLALESGCELTDEGRLSRTKAMEI